MQIAKKPHPVAMFCAWFLIVFLVLFPKGGVKISVVPLTWGYLFLALSAPPLILVRLLATPLTLQRRVLAVLLMLLPIQALFVYALLTYGVFDVGFAMSDITGLIVIPWLFLLLYPPFLVYLDGERLARYFCWCIVIAAIWGIFLFFWHPFTGHFVEIPYLTVNAEDYGQLERTKHIDRGLFFKLISTYNNGNLYGVATLMLYPLFTQLEKARWRRIVVWLALLLTLSRTVWSGLIIMEVLPLVVLAGKQFKSFPRVYIKTAMRQIIAVGLTVVLIFGALLFNASNLSFLLDSNLGGRDISGSLHSDIAFLPIGALGGFAEVVYVSALHGLGYTGMLAIVLVFTSPLLLLIIDRSSLQSPTRRAALKGLVLYMFLAGADGGLNYIPVMAFYWFIYMIYLFGWPGSVPFTAARRIEVPLPVSPAVLMPKYEQGNATM
jgi:hypothetical protein